MRLPPSIMYLEASFARISLVWKLLCRIVRVVMCGWQCPLLMWMCEWIFLWWQGCVFLLCFLQCSVSSRITYLALLACFRLIKSYLSFSSLVLFLCFSSLVFPFPLSCVRSFSVALVVIVIKSTCKYIAFAAFLSFSGKGLGTIPFVL